jgi:xylose isomerase
MGILGSIDMNRGDPQNGWDTDQFPNNSAEVALAIYYILKAGGLGSGGFNFDAKLRRQSMDVDDLFHAHIGGMDTVARGLLGAAALIEDGTLAKFVTTRYERWSDALGQFILQEGTTLAAIADRAVASDLQPKPVSGRQEYLENLVNRFV